ncbi:hypothetical protein WG66_007353, partial [Moniliophthora roreri]
STSIRLSGSYANDANHLPDLNDGIQNRRSGSNFERQIEVAPVRYLRTSNSGW